MRQSWFIEYLSHSGKWRAYRMLGFREVLAVSRALERSGIEHIIRADAREAA